MSRAAKVAMVATVILALAGTAGTAAAVDAPNWVAALYVEAQKVVGLRWSPVPGATAYKVLRSTTTGQGYQELVTVTAPQHFDKDIEPGTGYYYVLQAVAGAEVSANSAEKAVQIPGQKKVEAVKPPTWDKVTLSETTEFGKVSFKIGLFWNKSTSPNVVAYNLYKSATSGKDYQLLASVSDNKYVDAAAEEGKTYYYVVSALDNQFMETPFSPEKSIQVVRAVREEKKRAEKGPAMVTRGTKDLYRLEVKNYPADLALLPTGELAVAATFLLVFPSTEQGAEASDFTQEGWSDIKGVAVTNDGNILATSLSNGLLIITPNGTVKKEIRLPQPAEGAMADWGEEKYKLRRAYWKDAAQAPDGRYYVSDNNNHRVIILDEEGKYLETLGNGTAVGKISNPTQVMVSKDGFVYVNSFGSSSYSIWDKDGKYVRGVGELGQQVGTFGKIQGTSFDAAGNYYVADMQNGNVQVFNAMGDFLFMLSDEAEKGNMHVALVSGIAVTPDGKRIYAAESMSKSIAVMEILSKKQ